MAASNAPRAPYAPDPDGDAPAVGELGDLVDVEIGAADWSNRRCPRLSARRVVVRGARLTGSELAESMLVDVRFVECQLELVGLRTARLERVSFTDCRMNECDLAGARLTDVLFERCELRQATLSSAQLRRVELRGCDLAGLQGLDALRGVRMPLADVLANAPLLAVALGIEIVEV